MSTKRIIILGGGFGGVQWVQMLRDEWPQELDEVTAPIRPKPRLHQANALKHDRVEIERPRTR